VRTWGDGGIYDHKLMYFLLEQYTVVENSLGHRTVHHWTDDGLVYHTVDALGNSTYKQFDEALQLVEETDELGGSTRYAYDERGNRTAIVKPDGSTIGLHYDGNNQVVKLTNETSAVWQWTYDEQGQMTERVDPVGATIQYHYRNGLLAELTDAAGGVTRLEYDTFRNITGLITPDGERSQWRYDALGRCVEVLDPKGNAQHRLFDLLGQVQRVQEPDGNVRQLAYDGEGNVIHAKDQQHDVRFAYAGMGRMVAREEAGTRVAFRYDTEEQLVAIQNEHGSMYQFELDSRGDVVVERGFDGITRRYLRDAARRVTRAERPANLFTEYAYDQAGRLTGVQHWDGTAEQYTYRPDGELVSAVNANGKVRLERDILGRVVREIQDKSTIASIYDVLGRRTAVTSSLGANLTFARNHMGDVEKVSADGIHGNWEASFKRDALGLELERLLPGGVRNQWQRDHMGRPVEQRMVTAGGNVQRTRKYTWEVNDRLRQIQDSQLGVTKFEHDVFGNLTGAQYGDGQLDHRIADAVGNLFRWKNKKDRKYGPAGQLLEAEGTRYTYDVEGNLVQKVEPNGDIWRYEWNASGMLAKVVRPDGREVGFTYDALGRRLTKAYQGKTTHWVWDGNVPLHEWTEKRVLAPVYADDDRIAEVLQRQQELRLSTAGNNYEPKDLTTWVFEPESFAPLAKLKNGQKYSIVTDHLGTPLSMFDAQGEQTWQMELSVYGEARTFKGGREDCPLRYPGQYEDVETGMYYNRFRYYDAKEGIYITQDPIGLEGGIQLYSYVRDSNNWTDIFGLKCQGRDSLGKFTKKGADETIPGKDFEKIIADRLRNNPKVTVLGTNVHIKTKEGDRYVDVLFTNNKTGKIYAGEVKSNSATRSSAQKAKDKIIDSGKGEFGQGKSVPAALRGQSTKDVKTIEIKISG
jgi:RHS repeat-associated protein